MKTSKTRFIALVAICVCLNLGLGFLVSVLRLPLYLDSIGTVLATALGGLWTGILSGVLSVIIGSAYTPTLWAYAGTMSAIAVYASFGRPFGYLTKPLPTVVFGVGLGVVCAVISAPVTAYVWKGVSLSGTDAVTTFFSAKGGSLLMGVILGGLVTDPIDKLVTSFVVFALLRAVPAQFYSNPANNEPTDT
jgi:energy-coupling factor transport system substrate-specific component